MTVQILQGNVIDTLKSIAAGSVRCVVTSPPYFGLRSYLKATDPLKEYEIGTEATPELYISKLVSVFGEVWRVLADDGTLFLNLGDSYATNQKGGEKAHPGDKSYTNKGGLDIQKFKVNSGLKPKDLMMIPARVAIALQQDGWYLRSEIVWAKPNPMPESVKDRPTRSHEMIYLLTKSEKYYYDAVAIQEPAVYPGDDRKARVKEEHKSQPDEGRNGLHAGVSNYDLNFRNRRDVWTVTTKPYSGAHFATFPPDLIEPCILAGSAVGDTVLDPFGGSGTTASVAIKHNRKAIICELNNDYVSLIQKRMRETQPLLLSAMVDA